VHHRRGSQGEGSELRTKFCKISNRKRLPGSHAWFLGVLGICVVEVKREDSTNFVMAGVTVHNNVTVIVLKAILIYFFNVKCIFNIIFYMQFNYKNRQKSPLDF
jgi:hypothetical protein